MKLIKRDYEAGYHDNPLYREAPNSQRNRARLSLLLKHQPGGRLLEVGCGEGGFLRLAETHFSVEGVDISSTAIDTARPHFGPRVQVWDIEQHPLLPRPQAAGPYTVIAAFNILEHLRRPPEAVARIAAALIPGGLLIGSVPNNYGLVGGVNTRLGNFFDRTHQSTFAPDTWRRIFQQAGFSTLSLFGEVTLGRNRCRYLTGPAWPYLSFNLMFICTLS